MRWEFIKETRKKEDKLSFVLLFLFAGSLLLKEKSRKRGEYVIQC